ncbi:liprin-beta-2 isoform X2 [Venturia canescens]|uniref:liprin-beta-2 isoform X2 n=1 Tax=Venturia canescens TaxID=32260 RepID=UPI001C9C975F|nr:liprin-beta-2 isoform X2 [Venturia canescens]
MENAWSNGCGGERQDLDPIMEEEDKSPPKGFCVFHVPMKYIDSQSDSSDAASTIKRWDCRWTPSEAYDSSGTSSTSEQGEEYAEDYPRGVAIELPAPPSDAHGISRSQGCLCQNCLLGYARSIALRGSVPNICSAAANVAHLATLPPLQPSSCSANLIGFTKEMSPFDNCNHAHSSHQSRAQQIAPATSKVNAPSRLGSRASSIASLPTGNPSGRYGGSLDRRRRRLRNRNERDQRARSQSDLVYCDRERNIPPHYCSLQQFQYANMSAPQYASNLYINSCNNNTEERLRKLENERGALHMEVSVLSEQVDAQSTKILELETILQEKKDSLRQMEDILQKEILSRSALETQKLELLSSLSEMKLRQASLEHENVTLRTNSSPVSNGERFSRHAGQYSSLPRPPTSTKKGVAFGKVPQQISAAQTTVPLAVRGTSARCLSAPILAEEEKTVIDEAPSRVEETPPKPLVELSMEEVEEWLSRIGLESYAPELRRWGATGVKLLDATQNQIEKELDIKNNMHRKKLLYAVESDRCNGVGFLGSEKMDNVAVLRWLDDVGLPQHKEAFHNAKVDGRVLHRLTTEDLLNLGVTAQLHAASLRRGIQVLRELNFEFDNLERRAAGGNGADGSNVALWTNHRVMEWLRVVDLAEYAPNMRGSGVHGGLIIHEGRFTSELLATLLSIPPSKTLLRRHLTTHFNQILGREVVQHKREMESTLGFVPLTLTARLKVPKKSQFTLKRKKSKSEADYGNLVCPLESTPPDLEVGEQKRVIGCI